MTGIQQYHINPSSCPKCGESMGGATSIRATGGPGSGDFTVCVYCGALLVYDEAIHLRLPTLEEEKLAETDVGLRIALGIARRTVERFRIQRN